MWDLSKIGEEQSPEDAEDGPPELLVIMCVCVCVCVEDGGMGVVPRVSGNYVHVRTACVPSVAGKQMHIGATRLI